MHINVPKILSFYSINRKEFEIFSLGIIISSLVFCIFKITFPYPNVSPDSYTYIEAALNRDPLTLWPIGYSKFLLYLHIITYKATPLVTIQYMLLTVANVYLLLSLKRILSIPNYLVLILFLFLNTNSFTLQLANFIGADALFSSFSIIWFTQLIWLLIRPTSLLIILHAIVLLLTFTLRHNALWYPIVSITILCFNSQSYKFKIISLFAFILFPLLFVFRNCIYYHNLIGSPLYSAFAGWQMASNGLNAYAHTTPINIDQVPNQFRQIHLITNTHIAYLNTLKKRPDTLITTYYLWDNRSPLRQYLINKHKTKGGSKPITFKEWAEVSTLYMSYGTYLIKRSPLSYIKNFLYPNLLYFIAPPLEYLGVYNMNKIKFDEPLKSWFKFSADKITHPKNKIIYSNQIMQILVGLSNLLFPITILSLFFTIVDRNKKQMLIYLLMTLTYLGNLLFSITASGIVLRYQHFSFTITFTSTIFIIYYLVINAFYSEREKIVNPKIQNNVY